MYKKTCLALGLLLLIGCGAKKKIVYSPVYSSGSNYVKLMKVVDEKTGEPLEAVYDHPRQLAPEKLSHWLDVLYYEHYQWNNFGLDNKWIKSKVFKSKAITELVPQLHNAFSQASASDIIMFSIAGKNGDTSGRMWVKDNQWVCELYQINGYSYKGKDSSRLDNNDWRLMEAEGLKITRKIKCFVVTIDPDADLEEIQAPISVSTMTSRSSSTKASGYQLQTTDQKLRQLKQWLNEGLISKQQYQKKVDSLLKEF
jgi:hypothetical protein